MGYPYDLEIQIFEDRSPLWAAGDTYKKILRPLVERIKRSSCMYLLPLNIYQHRHTLSLTHTHTHTLTQTHAHTHMCVCFIQNALFFTKRTLPHTNTEKESSTLIVHIPCSIEVTFENFYLVGSLSNCKCGVYASAPLCERWRSASYIRDCSTGLR